MNRFLSKPAGPAIFVFALSSIIFILSVALVLAPAPLKAQTIISGDIAGTVMDPAGAAVPGASITVSNTGTGAVSQVKTGGAAIIAYPSCHQAPIRYL